MRTRRRRTRAGRSCASSSCSGSRCQPLVACAELWPSPSRSNPTARTNKRRSQHKIAAPTMNACPQCHSPRLPHRVCPVCGTYGGRDGRGRHRRRRRLTSPHPPCRRSRSPWTRTAPTSVLPRSPPAPPSRRRRGTRVLLFGPAAEIGPVPDGVEVDRRARLDRQGARSGIAPCARRRRPRSCRPRRRSPRAAPTRSSPAARPAPRWPPACSTSSARAASTARRSRSRCRCPGAPVLLLDVGANVEVRPEHLVQFAFMGAAFAQAVLGVAAPRVGLLSNGEEPERGTPDVIAAHARLAGGRGARLNFVGNVEGDAGDRGRRRRGRDGRLHRQHRAEADGGRLQQADARDPRRRDGEPARPSSAGCCCARRCGSCARRSTRRPRAAPTCSACGSSASSRTAASRRRGFAARDRGRGARGAGGRRRRARTPRSTRRARCAQAPIVRRASG